MKNRLVFVGLLALMFLVSGCDVLEAKRLNAEAAASRAKAAEISAAYDGRARIIEAETAEKLAEQVIYEENLEARQAADIHTFLLRQLELERRAARRANDLGLLAVVLSPLILVGVVVGVVVGGVWLAAKRRGRRRREEVLFRQIAHLQRKKLLRAISADDIELILSGAVSLDCYLLSPSIALVKCIND